MSCGGDENPRPSCSRTGTRCPPAGPPNCHSRLRRSETKPDTPTALFLAFQEAVAGRFSLDREIGRGGMGVVYLAREVRLDRLVAIKLLPPQFADEPALREPFLREARTAARLSHPNIVPIHSVD